jgi:hypothetical protein
MVAGAGGGAVAGATGDAAGAELGVGEGAGGGAPPVGGLTMALLGAVGGVLDKAIYSDSPRRRVFNSLSANDLYIRN